MSTRFCLQGNRLVVINPEDREGLDSLQELQRTAQQMSSNDACHEAVQTDRMTVRLVCDPARSFNLLDSHDILPAREAIANVVERENINNCRVTMTKDNKDFIVCQLASGRDNKPFWHVIQTGDFTARELNYFISILKDAGILNFNKNTHH